jgi:hypothetical protein
MKNFLQAMIRESDGSSYLNKFPRIGETKFKDTFVSPQIRNNIQDSTSEATLNPYE